MTNEGLVIAADIGGSHITAGVVDLRDKTILPGSLCREKVNAGETAAEIIMAWSKAIRKAAAGKRIRRIGLAVPGPFDYENGISLMKGQGKYENLYGLNINSSLAEILDNNPTDYKTNNDAACFLQGEYFAGAAKGIENAIGVTLGTGLGTCSLRHQYAINENLWNMPFKNSIAEDYLSTRWFTDRYHELCGNTVAGVSELSELIESDQSVRKIFNEFAGNLADFLKEFVVHVPAQLVVIGGNIAKSYPLFKESLSKSLAGLQLPELETRTALLGEEAALIGAASFWKDDI